jgi:hypothetical protein
MEAGLTSDRPYKLISDEGVLHVFTFLEIWRTRMKLPFFFMLLITTLASTCLAQDRNDYQLSLGLNYSDRARKNSNFRNKETTPASFQWQATQDLSLTISASLLTSNFPIPGSRATGRGDTTVGASYRLLNAEVYPFGFTFAYTYKIPTAIKGLGTDQGDHQLTGIVNRKFFKYRVAGEFHAGDLISGLPAGKPSSTPQFAFVETTGLGRLRDPKDSYVWSWLHETDLSPAAGGSPASVTESNLVEWSPSAAFAFAFGPNYAFTPYDSRLGFSVGVFYNGHFGKKPPQ